jgi:hypothetical protein
MTARFVHPLFDVGSGITPSSGAKLFFFEDDGVTPKDTHTTKAGVSGEPGNLNANPVIALSTGVFPDIYITGDYKITLKDKNNVQIGTGLLPINEFAAVTDSAFVKNFDTLAEAIADAGLVDGDTVNLKERSTGNGGGAIWDVFPAGTFTVGALIFDVFDHATLPLQLKLRDTTPILAVPSGVLSSPSFITLSLQAAIDSITVSGAISSIVKMDINREYALNGVGIVIPPNVTLNCSNARITYSGTGKAFTLGNSDTVLSKSSKLINLNLLLTDKDSGGVLLRGTDSALVEGVIEGGFAPFDNTRTNIGVEVDGRNISSFFNEISVGCNHMHEGFRVGTTGTVQPTSQYFRNCRTLGDQATDNLSVGYNFTDTAVGFADGTRIHGGNVELVNIAFLMGNNAQQVDINTRVEINITATSRLIKHGSNVTAITYNCAGVNSALIGAVAGGIENFDSGNNYIIDRDGNIRTGGNASSFAGFAAPIFATNMATHLYKENANTNFLTRDEAAGTSRYFIQPGAGSAGFGAALRLHGHAHASKAGVAELSSSAGVGSIDFTNGAAGTLLASITTVGSAADDTTLLVLDITAGTVKRASRGAVDSGGAGFRLLRIPN